MAGADGLTAADAILDRAGRLFAGEKRRFAVALSGGADSAVAAWVAVQAVGAARVRAIHVHHGREASEDLARAASEIAAVLDIAFTQVGVEVPAGPSFEAQARSVRLPALEAAAAAGEEIVTGHHRGDAAETVLGNLIRGAGAAGLSGISARRGRWMRPLLSIPRAEVKAAAAELGLPFVDDPTNTDRSLTRNLLRLDVLPELEQRLGPGVESSLARAAGLLAADDEELDRLASCVRVVAEDDAVTAPAVELAALAAPVAARVARRMLRAADPPYPGTSRDVSAVLAVAGGEAARLQLGTGMFAVREGPLVVVYRDEPEPAPEQVLVPGAAVTWARWTISMRPIAGPPPLRLGRSRVVADLREEATIRSAVAGDRIDIDGGSKPVREAMSEAHIPLRMRAAWPVVVAGGKIAWVPGARLASWSRYRPEAGGQAVELAIEGTGV